METTALFSHKDLTKLIVPLIVDQLLGALIGMIDILMVSNVGEAAVSGVSLVDSVNTLFILFFSALAAGGAVVCTQQIGAKEADRAGNTARQMMLLSGVISFCFLIPMQLLRNPLLHWIYGSVEASVMQAALTYYRITVFSYPFLALTSAASALYRGIGNSRLPMAVSVGSNLLNIAGNAVLLFVFHMGVAGVALSTLFSRFVGTAVLLVCLRRPGQLITVRHYTAIRPDAATLRLIVRIGIPSGLENAMFQFGKLAVQSTLSTLGTAAIAAQAVVYNMEYLTSMAPLAIGTGILTVAGRCMGAGRPEEAKRYTLKLTGVAELCLLAGSGIILALSPWIIRLSGFSAETAALAQHLIVFILAVKCVLWVCAFTLPSGLRAAGDVRFPLLAGTASMWICRVGLCTLLCRVSGLGLYGIWIGMMTDWLARGTLYLVRFLRGKWQSIRVLSEHSDETC